MTNPYHHTRSAPSILNQMHAAWQAEIAHTHDKPKDMILTNWHLGAADGWYRAIEMVKAAIGPEPTRPAVTREAVADALAKARALTCAGYGGDCLTEGPCSCQRQTDALMTLIGDAP